MNRILKSPTYVALIIFLFGFFYAVFSLLPIVPQLYNTLVDSRLTLLEALKIDTVLLLAKLFQVKGAELIYTLTVAMLAATNLTLLVYLHKRSLPGAPVTTSTLGMLGALFGFGCLSCGSMFLTALSATLGGGIFVLLPFQGRELGWFGIVFLIISVFLLDRVIRKPLVCAVE